MSFPNDSSIERLALRMIDRTLAKQEWTHAGHFAAALWLLRHRRELTTPTEIRRLIMSYNESTNTANTDTSGYHHTITLASMRAASDVLDSVASATPLHIVLETLMASDLGNHNWLLSYWSQEKLFSVEARRQWLEPDRAPLPF